MDGARSIPGLNMFSKLTAQFSRRQQKTCHATVTRFVTNIYRVSYCSRVDCAIMTSLCQIVMLLLDLRRLCRF